MTMLAKKNAGTEVLSLEGYEARIALYKEQIGTGYIGIGRTLNEAKAAGVVPHGQWESWVEATTGLTIRQAQRCMQAATEIRDGSEMARLEMSKALLLLSSGLDVEQREELAGKAAEEGATVRELREEIRKLKVKVVGETGATAEIKAQLKKAEEEQAQLIAQMTERENAWKARLEAETGKAYERGLKEQTDGVEQEIRKEFQGKLDYNQSQINALRQKLNGAESLRKTAERENSRQWDRGFEAGKRESEEMAEEMANELEKQIRGNVEISEGLKKKDEEIRALKAKLLAAENNRVEVVPADYEQLKRDRADLIEAAEEAEKRAQDAEARLEEARSQGGGNAGDAYRTLRSAVERFMAEADLLPTRAMELHGDKRVATQLAQLDAWLNWMRDELSKAGDRVDLEGAVSIR